MEDTRVILIIEDDDVLRANTTELLELSGFKVITAQNGKTGIEIALKYIPDLILCDILMPQMDGYEALEYLSQNQRTMNIPFLFMSAKTDQSEIRKGMNCGADDYITKPFKETDLLNAIKKRLNKLQTIKNSFSGVPNVLNKKENISSLNEFKDWLRLRGENYVFVKKKKIYSEHENANYIFLIEKGIVKTVKMDDDGKELITGLFREGSLFGLSSFNTSSPYDETAVAIENGVGYRFSSKYFREIIQQNPELILEIAVVLSENLSILKEHMLEIAYSSVLKKTTHTILEFTQKIQNGPRDIIKVTRNELAQVAGISTESFIRSLSVLRKKNILEIEGRNIRILDFDKLKKI